MQKNHKIYMLLISLMLLIIPSKSLAYNDFYVRDSVGILSEEVKDHISDVNDYYEKSTEEKPQVVVDIIRDLEGVSIEDYAIKRFEELKIGSKDRDNGVLIVISMNDRKFRLEIGYGLEGAIPDIEAKRILDASMPLFKNKDYSEGVKNIFDGVITNINEEYSYDESEVSENIYHIEYSDQSEDVDWWTLILIILYFILNVSIHPEEVYRNGKRTRRYRIKMKSSKSGGGGRSGGRSFGGGGRSGGGGASGGW